MIIRPYQPADAFALSSTQQVSGTPIEFEQHMAFLMSSGGYAWVIGDGEQLAGYAAVSPLPGLDGVADLEGGIAPALQRQGLGGRLLAHLQNQLQGTPIRQLSYPVTTLDSPAAQFLRSHHFYIGHEEWVLMLPNLTRLPARPQATWRTYRRKEAIERFCALYTQSFTGFPWYQPYTAAEVDASLDTADDILFLIQEETPIGFIWTRQGDQNLGEIEPIGVVAQHQGKGHGRTLLLAGLHRLAALRMKSIRIGAWRDNKAAIRLYQSVGFQHTKTITYLNYDIT